MKVGDTIKCGNAKEMLRVASALAHEGIITMIRSNYTLEVTSIMEGDSEVDD